MQQNEQERQERMSMVWTWVWMYLCFALLAKSRCMASTLVPQMRQDMRSASRANVSKDRIQFLQVDISVDLPLCNDMLQATSYDLSRNVTLIKGTIPAFLSAGVCFEFAGGSMSNVLSGDEVYPP